MSEQGLREAVAKMTAAGVDATAVDVFAANYRRLESGATGAVPEDTIEPLDSEPLDAAEIPDDVARQALAGTVVVKLNGGLGTSMGLRSAKSMLQVRDGLTFLDIIARQVLAARRAYGVRLPLLFMNSFRTHADTQAALARYPDLGADLLGDFVQNMVPKLLADDLGPVAWPKDPELEWCPPGHGDIYSVLYARGILDAMLDAGYTQVFVSNADNLGAAPDAGLAGWFARSGSPFAIEAVRRAPSDRKGGHFARRRSDGRVILRETAQTLPEDLARLADLDRHRFASTNNIWFDIAAVKAGLDARDGNLGLPFIRNTKTVDPADPASPKVIQMESAMGAAVEVFAGATTVGVDRSRFVPVKTTDDLLVLRSDCYRLDDRTFRLNQECDAIPFIELGTAYTFARDFDKRFPYGVPSIADAASLRVEGDWTFGPQIRVVGECALDETGGVVPGHRVLGAPEPVEQP